MHRLKGFISMNFDARSYTVTDPIDRFYLVNNRVQTSSHVALVLLMLTWALPATSQVQTYTISGFVSDFENGERLIGANLYVYELQVGAVANNYGFYSLTLPEADTVYVRVSYVGFQTRMLAINLRADINLDIELTPESYGLDTVLVTGERVEESTESTQMSVIDLPIEKIKAMPALLGEADVLKAIQLLPGVQSGSEGSSGIYVRGGGPDQNLLLLDGAPVYNASHVFGFFSVFNSDALQHVNLIKGGFPARYGGRLSSVIDISMKEGNLKRFGAEGAIGLIFSKLTLQGPIIKDRMSFIVSGRRTYIDVVSRPFMEKSEESENPVFFFYDLNAKVNYIASRRSRFYLSFYTGDDVFGNSETERLYEGGEERLRFGVDWGNITSTFRWNYVFSPQLFSNTSLTYSKYEFDVLTRVEQINRGPGLRNTFEQIEYLSGINDWNGKIDFDYVPAPDHYIRFGANVISHAFNPGIGRFREEGFGEEPIDMILTPTTSSFSGLEFYTYVEDDARLSNRVKVNAGIHFSGMRVEGRFYSALQPRLSARYLLNQDLSVKASFSTMQQYLHLLTNTGINLPTDLWVAATDRIRPQKAWQAAAGATHTFGDGMWEVTVEGYYKDMQNLIEFKPGANFITGNEDWQDKIEVGNGHSYGGELFLQRKLGRTTGWFGYTLSWTERTFEGFNNGRTFPYRYDRRHDISIVVTHEFSDHWDLGATWVYGTGNSITLARSRFNMAQRPGEPFQYSSNDFDVYHYGDRNSHRMGAYHRMDLALSWTREKSSGFFGLTGPNTRKWTLSVYNVYNRHNPFFYYASRDENGNPGFKQFSLFPIIPSITWSFAF